MSVKKKKKTRISNVQPAEKTDNAADKAEPQAAIPEAPVQKQEVPTTAPVEKPIVVSQPLKNILARINQLGPEEQALISKFGLPIKDMAEWMFMMEQTLRQVPSVTEKGIADELFKKSMEQRQQAAAPGTPSTGNVGVGNPMGGVAQLLALAKEAGLTGGGSSVLQEKMEKVMGAILDKSLESITKGDRFSQLLEEELMKSKAKAMAAVVTQTS